MSKQNRSLPQQPTSFIGRENEVAAIINLLQDPECRLLTLIGAGGVGKTRLGFEAADRIVKSNIDRASSALFPDGVYFVLLQSVASVTNLMPAIAGALGFEFYDPRHPEKQLTDHLGDQQILLVLDNLEHLPDAADVIDTLLSGASGLKVLATSREPLLLGDEWLFHVDGLPVPVYDAGAVDAFDAVQLFVERARRARYDFSFDDNRACVVQICRLVDGLPLAIELAAAWLRRLSCREIAAEIERNLDILETDMRGVPDRQRSMRAVLDYSWELFSQDERELFMMLSVFQGSFQREAAEQICGASLQTLSALVDKSMVAVLGNGRYQLHELQRQYGAEKLGKETALETAVRDRHCEYFTTFMDRPFRDYWGYRGKETLQEIDAEIDNVLAAWNWAVAQGRYSDLHSCIDGLLPYWYHRWHEGVEEAYHEGLIALRSAEPGPERDLTMGWALAHQSSLDLWMVRLQYAKERAAESIVLLEPLNARHELAHAYGARARAACWGQDRDPEQAQALVQEAVALFEETGQYELQGLMYTMLGYLNYDIGDLEESEKWFQKDNELSRRTADPLGETRSLGNLGRHALVLGRYDQAGQYLMESLKIARDLKNKSWINEALNRLGLLAEAVGDLETAEHTFQECLAGAKEWGKPYSIALSMTNLASVVVARKEYALATALYQESTHFFQGNGMIQADRLCGLGRIAFEEQQYAQARRLYEESLRICKESGFRLQQARNVDALGRIALAQGLVWEAQTHFRAAVEESIALGAPPVMLECMISTGELFAHEGDEKEAAELAMLVRNHKASRAESVERAVRLLKEIETAVSVEELQAIQSAAGDDLESELAKLPARLTPTERSAAAASGATSQPLLDPLSERELELLRLVAAGKSNREIAAELVLALGTVKSHLHNIFQKLDAGSRTQAVVRAQELDLL